jgi:hypothetical protein
MRARRKIHHEDTKNKKNTKKSNFKYAEQNRQAARGRAGNNASTQESLWLFFVFFVPSW